MNVSDFGVPSSSAYANQQNTLHQEKTNTKAQNTEQSSALITATSQTAGLTLPQILLIVWLSGMTACLSFFSVLAFLLKRKIAKRTMAPSTQILMLVQQVRAELGIKSNIKVLCQDDYGTPALLYPRTIFLPMRTLAAMDDEQVKNCIRHECMHYKRGDQHTNLLLLILNAVYWFNPIVWLAFYQVRRDMETACDSAVVRHMDTSARRDYATLILGMFSQLRYGHIALGMIQGSTKKIAEQRIKGIFMRNKSGKSVRFVAAALAVMLFVCCFTTACQPTPDAPVVVGKRDDLSSLIQSTPRASSAAPELNNDALYAKLGAPKHWNIEELALDGKLKITADADIELPGVSQLPAATASLSEFTQEDLDKIAKVLGVEGAEWTEAGIQTKEQIEVQILNQKATLAKMRTENYSDDSVIIKKGEAAIKNMEQQYNDAPSNSELRNIEFKIDKIEYFNGITGDGFEGSTQIDGQSFCFFAGNYNGGAANKIKANYGTGITHFEGTYADKPYGVSLTKEQAATQANEIAKKLTDELKLCYVAPTATFKHFTSRNWGWACVFMREINGCPTAYESTDVGSNIDTKVKELIPYEKMVIVMDDLGMVSFTWDTPMTIEAIDNPDVSLLSFDEVSKRAIEQTIQRWGYEASGKENMNGEDISDPGCIVKITKVELGLTRIALADRDSFYYIPVWNFFTTFEHTDGYYEKHGIVPFSWDGYVGADEEGNPESIVTGYPQAWGAITINAIDGSVIDRDLGY